MGKMLGERIALGRVEKDLTVAALSRAAGVSPSHIHRIEDGDREPGYKVLVNLGKALGIEIAEMSRIQMMDKDFPAEEDFPDTEDNGQSAEDIRKEIDRHLGNMNKTDLAVVANLLRTYFL